MSGSGVVVSSGSGNGGGRICSGGGVGVCGPGLFRSRSLPHLFCAADSGVGGSLSDGGCPDNGGVGVGVGVSLLLHHSGVGVGVGAGVGSPLPGHCGKSQPAGLFGFGDVRQLVTLKQHYYPEGGWGWVVATVAMAVHLLGHGLHLASGVFVLELTHKFGPDTVVPAGILPERYFYPTRNPSSGYLVGLGRLFFSSQT